MWCDLLTLLCGSALVAADAILGLMPAWQGVRPYLPGGQSSTGGGKALPSWQADVSEKGVRSHPPGTGGRPPTHCGVKARLLGVVLAMWLDL